MTNDSDEDVPQGNLRPLPKPPPGEDDNVKRDAQLTPRPPAQPPPCVPVTDPPRDGRLLPNQTFEYSLAPAGLPDPPDGKQNKMLAKRLPEPFLPCDLKRACDEDHMRPHKRFKHNQRPPGQDVILLKSCGPAESDRFADAPPWKDFSSALDPPPPLHAQEVPVRPPLRPPPPLSEDEDQKSPTEKGNTGNYDEDHSRCSSYTRAQILPDDSGHGHSRRGTLEHRADKTEQDAEPPPAFMQNMDISDIRKVWDGLITDDKNGEMIIDIQETGPAFQTSTNSQNALLASLPTRAGSTSRYDLVLKWFYKYLFASDYPLRWVETLAHTGTIIVINERITDQTQPSMNDTDERYPGQKQENDNRDRNLE